MFKQVSRLEEEVGCPLFIRSKTGVTLSEAGKIFYEGARNMLKNQETLITKCRQAGNHEFIRVGSVEHQVILDPVNAAFGKKYPEIEIRRIVHPNHSGEYRVSNHIMDVGETFLFDHEEPLEYNFTKLSDVRYCAAVNIHHPLAGLQSVALWQLKKYRTIVIPLMLRKAYLEEIREVFADCINNLIESDEVDRQVEIAFETAGSKNVLITANPFIRSVSDLKLIPLENEWIRTYGIIYLSPASETVEKYVRCAVETYEQMNQEK
jgi:DNA-binding transcriptional LysR family regulator